MHLDTAETEPFDRLRDHGADPATVPAGVDEREAEEAVRAGGHDACHLAIRLGIVRREGGEQDRAFNARSRRPPQVVAQRSGRVPGSGQAIALAGVAVTVDDHRTIPPQVIPSNRRVTATRSAPLVPLSPRGSGAGGEGDGTLPPPSPPTPLPRGERGE